MSRNHFFLVLALPLVVLILSNSAVNSDTIIAHITPNALLADSIAKGIKLALIHCQRCHLFTEPALLGKKPW